MLEPVTDPGVLEGYLTDASNLHGHAEGLYRPTSTAEVAAIVSHCQRNDLALTVTAGRTSTTAGPVPFGGWLLSTERLDRIVRIDADSATAQAGVYLGAFQREIEAKGRFYPPDPTSRHDCTLGASIACNASGARTFKYGATRRWIRALEVVLPTGEIRRFERGEPVPAGWPVPAWHEPAVKTAAGYSPPRDAVDLFVGQEGTLGIVTEATVELLPLPSFMGILAFFPDRPSAVAFMRAARDAARADREGPLSPRCLEYLDAACLGFARARGIDVPAGAGAVLFCEQELPLGEDAHLAAWFDALTAHGALLDATLVSTDPAGQQRLQALRHAVPAGINEQVVKNGMPKVGTDLAVPDAALDAMMALYEAAPFERVLFGHLGDNHLHLNLLPKTATELAAAKEYYFELAKVAVGYGGTVSAEHGIGKLKKNQLALMIDPGTLASFRGLKRHLDPRWILGRGNLFDK
jgi:D-lactate dehydrogenase (cytochrome)